MARNIVINYPVTSVHGWGIYGLNLALSWASDSEIVHATTKEINANVISIAPLRWRALQPFCARSAGILQLLLKEPNQPFKLNTVLLAALNNRLNSEPGPHGGPLLGTPSLGVVFFESEDLGQSAQQNAARHACMVAGSSWNAEVLRAHGIPRVETVLQGIDPTAWHNPWPQTARGIDQTGRSAPLPFTQDGKPDIDRWAAANGIKPEQFLNLGLVPNASMPTILREMDAAVFPNRCEGGTNLVAMETMACGVPTILSANSGHLDLLQDGSALALTDQRPIPTAPGWRESNIDEIVAALEVLYTDRARAAALGAAGAKLLSQLTWTKTASEMKRIISAL